MLDPCDESQDLHGARIECAGREIQEDERRMLAALVEQAGAGSALPAGLLRLVRTRGDAGLGRLRPPLPSSSPAPPPPREPRQRPQPRRGRPWRRLYRLPDGTARGPEPPGELPRGDELSRGPAPRRHPPLPSWAILAVRRPRAFRPSERPEGAPRTVLRNGWKRCELPLGGTGAP